jgi:chemotaxis protein CheX
MNAEFINPFINATKRLMEIMVGIRDFEKTSMSVDQQIKSAFDVSAIIGVTGLYKGNIMLSFSTEVAVKMLSQILGETVDEFDDDVCDTVAEMVNIITSNAEKQLSKSGYGGFHRSVPSVVIGKGHIIKNPQHTPCISISFHTELGGFALQVSLKEAE